MRKLLRNDLAVAQAMAHGQSANNLNSSLSPDFRVLMDLCRAGDLNYANAARSYLKSASARQQFLATPVIESYGTSLYLTIVLLMCAMCHVGLATFVTPTFFLLAEESGYDLPWIIQFVFGPSILFFYVVLASVLAIVWASYFAVKQAALSAPISTSPALVKLLPWMIPLARRSLITRRSLLAQCLLASGGNQTTLQAIGLDRAQAPVLFDTLQANASVEQANREGLAELVSEALAHLHGFDTASSFKSVKMFSFGLLYTLVGLVVGSLVVATYGLVYVYVWSAV